MLTNNTTTRETLYHPIEESISWLHNVDDSTNNEYDVTDKSSWSDFIQENLYLNKQFNSVTIANREH